MKRNHSIQHKLLLSNFLLTFLPIVIFSVVLFMTLKIQIEKDAVEKSAKTLNQISQNVDTTIEAAINLSNLYYFDNDMQNTLSQFDTFSPEQVLQRRTMMEEKIRYFNIILRFKGCYTSVFDEKGVPFVSWNAIGYDVNSMQIREVLAQRKLQKSRSVYTVIQKSPVRRFDKETHVFYIAQTLRSQSSDEELGVLVLGIDEDVLYQRYKDIVDEVYNIFILDENGTVISAKDKSLLGRPFEAPYADAVLHRRTPDDKKMFVTTYPIANTSWTIVQAIPRRHLLSPLKLVYPILGITILCCVFLCWWLSFFISQKLTRPIKELAATMERISNETLDIEVTVSSQDEIGELAQGLRQLVARLKSSIEAQIATEKQKYKAEYEMLQAQINPHFLFNTLSTIRCLIAEQEWQKSDDVIIALGKLLRASIGKYDDVIPIEEELENVRHYIAIQQTRYTDCFSVRFEIDPTVGQYKIIKLLLQPIVENAIFYGVDEKQGNSHILISATSTDSGIQFVIQDDGVGMSEQTIESIFNGTQKSPKHLYNGVGLGNVINRINLYYGNGWGLDIHSELGKGTSVIIRIPKVL